IVTFDQLLPLRPDHHPDFICGTTFVYNEYSKEFISSRAALIRGTQWMVIDLLTGKTRVRLHSSEMPVRDVILTEKYLIVASHLLLVICDLDKGEGVYSFITWIYVTH